MVSPTVSSMLIKVGAIKAEKKLSHWRIGCNYVKAMFELLWPFYFLRFFSPIFANLLIMQISIC